MQWISNADKIIVLLRLFLPASETSKLLQVSHPTYLRWVAGARVHARHSLKFTAALDWLDKHVQGKGCSVDVIEPEIVRAGDSDVQKAMTWLEEYLDRPKLFDNIRSNSPFKEQILRRAARKLGVKSKITGFGKNRRSRWSLK